jgi:lipopolysaccharide/colanic/teichoic acid biosynthesis glycosyltransferase
LWTVQGHRRVEYPARASVELAYVDNSSLMGDLSILLQHVPVVLMGQGEE